MKLTKKLTTEINQFLTTYWDAYLKGDLKEWSKFLPEDYRNIGTTNEEIWNSRQEILDYTYSVFDQMIGMAEVRNRKVQIIPYKGYFMAHELGDLYVKSDDGWNFYAPIRLSSLLEKTKGKWLVLHQHGSYPDSRTEQGEAFAFDALKAENKKLQAAVDKRTKELKVKNRELAIEASMERVRAVAMGMQEASDLLKICEILFKELTSLGFNALRNTMVNLNNDQASLLHNYDYGSKSGGELTDIPYDSHPATRNMVNKLKSSVNAFGQFSLTGKKLEEWRDYRKKLGEKDDPKLKNTKKLSYYFYSIGTGSIGVSTYEPISKEQLTLLERFRNVFELAYRRYIDIQQAEDQAREAKIEAALEKVRARTMAMQHSSELPEAANLLFLEVQALGIPAWSCGYNILAEDEKSVMCWMSSEGNIQSGFHLPFTNTGEKSFPQWQKAIKDKVPFLVQELGGKDIEEHYDYMRTLPGLEPILKELDEAGLALPTYQINHLSFFNGGFLLFITYEKVPEAHALFKRFTRVFDQTYARFLDLQKAEAQTREAQIETALERVRSTAMAMHKTRDIASVVTVFFEQLKFLGVNFVQSWINVMHPDEGIVDVWFSPLKDVYDDPAFFKIPLALFENTTVKAWKAGEAFSYVSFNSKEELDSFFKACDDAVGTNYFSHLQKKLKLERLDLIDANYKFGAVSKSGIVKATPEEESILQRFAKVFEQAYTRFLDLQKAEEQAQEAEIELALERVRARSMAMQTSEELKDVVKEIFDQMALLKINAEHAGIVVDYEPKQDWHFWVAESQDIPAKITVPYLDSVWDKQFTSAKKKSHNFFTTELNFDEKNSFYKKLLPHIPGLTKKSRDFYLSCPGLAISTVIQKDIGLYIENFSGVPYSAKENDTLMRFGKVFQQTYTRFLDLQKAEEQAREAQIEAALERVRAKSMAMHTSENLLDTISEFFAQLKLLDVVPVRCGVAQMLTTPPSWIWTATNATTQGDSVQASGMLTNLGHPVLQSIYDHWVDQENYFPVLKGKDLRDYYKVLREELTIPEFTRGEVHYGHYFNFKEGNIFAWTTEPLRSEEVTIFERFSLVLSLTYRRYLDLQKAEAQAREAEIELALERVRARTMAMQHSDELGETSFELFEQFKKLGNTSEQISIGIFKDNENAVDLYSTLHGAQWQEPVTVELDEPVVMQKIRNSWKKQKSSLIVDITGENLKKYNKFRKKLSHFDYHEKRWVIHCAFFSKGVLTFSTTEPLPAETIQLLTRFAGVFNQTYTRFLDLQKAEAQAREAKIEASLERIRAKSMAMHKSDDLSALSLELVKEVQILGKATWFCAFNIYDDDPKGSVEWGSNGENTFARYRTPREGVFLRYFKAGKKGITFLINEIGPDKCPDHYEYLCSLPGVGEQLLEMKEAGLPFPAQQIDHVAYFKYGYLLFITYEPAPELHDIFQRFAKVFEQTYTRFLDLQKAEAQAREAQVELSLERVRAEVTAMQESSDLFDIVVSMRKEFLALGHEADYFWHMRWTPDFYEMSMTSEDGNRVGMVISVPKFVHDAMPALAQWEKGKKPICVLPLNADAAWDYIENMNTHGHYEQADPNAPTQEDIQHIGGLTFIIARTTHGEIGYSLPGEVPAPPKDALDTLERFALVFDLAYKRFEDLKATEHQHREAQIELALERVRSRTMAMHSSSELADTALVLFQQLRELGIKHDRTNIGIVDEASGKIDFWLTTQKGSLVDQTFSASIDESNTLKKIYKGFKDKKKSIVVTQKGAELKKWISFITDKLQIPFSPPARNERRVQTVGYISHGMLIATSTDPLNDESLRILERFAAVFDQTYTRFLDLKKAEDQARESQIELSLERIRAQATAMKVSSDLLDIVVTMRTEFVSLGFEAHFFWHMRWLPEKYEKAMTGGDGSRIGMVMTLPRHIHGDIELVDKWEKGEEPALVFPMDVETAVPYVDKMINLGDFEQVDPNAPTLDDVRHIGGLTFIMARTTHGEIGYSLPGVVPKPPVEAIATLTRFAGAFDLAYRRFEDLKQAEAREKEAIKDASLDRVRAEIASMRSPKDLERITPLVWKELTTLGVPFFRCGIFIIKEEEEMVHAFLSTPAGESLAALHIPFNETEIGMIVPSIENWRAQTVYSEEWDQKRFLKNMQLFMKRGDVKSRKKYQDGDKPPEKLVLQLVPFKQGMLYVGNSEALVQEHIDLVKDLANAFSIAYSRYEDFVKLEEAKEKVDLALTDLKSAQSQLVHAEKMASLGELTAGIAHEIQNPLNFVNNFSEVNKELMDELLEELLKGDFEEAKAIAQDIMDNDAKIMHHGKRAEGIVKGMLQHSRTSSGEKELTDINVLADEYLRLSYHGLRAKDKSFNADFELDLDESLPKVNVIPQDMGRVLLNLINNAFYAVSDVEKPKVIVTTKSLSTKIQITVTDNGSGIPENIKDKIFQPFFTTKATGEGTGLGLSLSYDIITKGHGGELKLDSQESKGSSFSIVLPIQANN